MLRTRVLTALVLLALLLLVVYSNSYPLFALVVAAFFGAAAWESFRLFKNRSPFIGAVLWTATFIFLIFQDTGSLPIVLFGLCVAFWGIRLGPSLALGLPPLDSAGNRFINGVYGLAILGCFLAIVVLFRHSPLYLLSVMAIVWIADIGAYFSGKAFGKRKLAPSISPGKSWEGAIGGGFAVLVLSGVSAMFPFFTDTFSSRILTKWGWPGFAVVMTVMVAISIVGDLFESQLKRRAGMKDSSNLLPGHGGVLDRVDALIPTLPLAVLLDLWL